MNYEWATKGPWITNIKTDTEYKYIEENGVLYIAFQGSTGKEDWKQNFSFWIRPYKNMPSTWFAHSGFVKKWKSIEDEILNIVSRNANVFVSGFSQGGAVAVLAHESIRFHYPEKAVECKTWGCPRVVWFWNFCKIKDRFNEITRVERRWDVVPHVPPWLFGYKHVGKVVKQGNRWPTFKIVENHMSYGENQ